MTTILLVEDEPLIAEFTLKNLTEQGFDARSVGTGQEALDLLTHICPDLIALDLRLPDIDGFEVCRRIRRGHPSDGLCVPPDVPIVILTACDEDTDKLRGFDLGADDYVTKPFNPLELIARLNAVLRRSGSQGDTRALIFGNLSVHPAERAALLHGNPVSLTPMEFNLLLYFARNPHRAIEREELLRSVWGYSFGKTRTVDEHVKRLRQKLKTLRGMHIATVRGVGYCFRRSGDLGQEV